MISLETALKLKEAGLPWEPKQYDFFWCNPEQEWTEIQFIATQERADKLKHRGVNEKHIVWFPRLDQLLEWLEGRGYCYSLMSTLANDYWLQLICRRDGQIDHSTHLNRNALDTAAEAVLWLLERKATPDV